MKRSYPTNVDGQIFYIDEDAFLLLQNYLNQLHATFGGEEGAEIVSDIESRIRELFAKRIESGACVIVLEDVNQVIETMGRPEDLGGDTEGGDTSSHIAPDATRCADNLSPEGQPECRPAKKLYRNMKNKVFGGVFGGLAVYLGWNANVMRLLYVVLTFTLSQPFHVWPFILAYLICWMVIPAAVTPRQILQMKGAPVNIGTVGQTVMADSGITPPPVSDDSGNFFTTFFTVVGKCLLGLIGITTLMMTIGCLLVFIAVLFAAIVLLGTTHTPGFMEGFGGMEAAMLTLPTLTAVAVASLLAGIITGLVTWGCASVLFPTPKTSKSLLITFIVIIMILIVFLACLLPSTTF